MQFVRAPDENVFIARKLSSTIYPSPEELIQKPAFNLLEVFFLIIPFEWWMKKEKYERLNNAVMGVIYSPLLLITAYMEIKEAHLVKRNRRRGEADEYVEP